MSKVIHYSKFYDNVEQCNVYLCNSKDDMDFIPKEQCSYGDKVKLTDTSIAFYFNGETWEEHK